MSQTKCGPNTALQRTRVRPAGGRSPLSFEPLGGESVIPLLLRVPAAASLTLALVSGMVEAAPSGRGSQSFAGCYQFRLGPWRPALDLKGDEQFITTPAKAELTMRPSTWEKGTFVAQAMNPRLELVQTEGYWRVERNRRIFINWTDGFSGVSMLLKMTESGLEGTAETHWDFPRQVQRSSVAGVRIPCTEERKRDGR